MKKIIFLLMVFLISSNIYAQDGDIKILFLDYGLSGNYYKYGGKYGDNYYGDNTTPLSIGLISWSNKDIPRQAGMYLSLAFFTYNDFVRFEVGGVGTWSKRLDAVYIAPLTGISVLLHKHIVAGVWYAPFYNLNGKNSDDPWGFMLGYSFSL